MNEEFGIWIALFISAVAAFYTYRQAQKADQALAQGNQLAQSNAVMHFTDRFFDLLKDSGNNVGQKIINNEAWAYQFWSLHATEFYFFHHNWIPTFMYSLWMVGLAELYSEENGEKIRQSHEKYLRVYSLNYDEMVAFFTKLYDMAQEPDEKVRNDNIATWIEEWLQTNMKREVSSSTSNQDNQNS